MATVEVLLVYRPAGVGAEGEFRLARSADPAAIRATGEAAIAEMREAAGVWEGIDPNLTAIHQAEADRLERVLRLVMPDDETPRPPLKLVPQPGNGRPGGRK